VQRPAASLTRSQRCHLFSSGTFASSVSSSPTCGFFRMLRSTFLWFQVKVEVKVVGEV
jgi:hypothetical protein